MALFRNALRFTTASFTSTDNCPTQGQDSLRCRDCRQRLAAAAPSSMMLNRAGASSSTHRAFKSDIAATCDEWLGVCDDPSRT